MPAPELYDIGDTVEFEILCTVKNTVGSIDAGSTQLTVQSASGYANADPIVVYGAGDAGGDLVTTVSGAPSGNVITLAAAAKTSVIRGKVGKLANPTTVTVKVALPDGTTSSPAVTNPSVGRYTASFDPTLEGSHWWEFKGTGAVKVAQEREFLVVQNRVP